MHQRITVSQWHHISGVASQIISNSTVCSTAFQRTQQRQYQHSTLLAILGIHQHTSNVETITKWWHPHVHFNINTLRPRQNGRHFADDTFNRIFVNENVRISIEFSLKFVPKGPINNIPALVQIMAWRRPGDKPLSETVMVRLPTHICVTRPQWVNINVILNKWGPSDRISELQHSLTFLWTLVNHLYENSEVTPWTFFNKPIVGNFLLSFLR